MGVCWVCGGMICDGVGLVCGSWMYGWLCCGVVFGMCGLGG